MHPEIHLQQKAEKIFAAKPYITTLALWFDIAIYSFFIFVVVSAYAFVTDGRYDLISISRVCANVGLLLIGLSFMLSGLCYFWNFADHYIIYRKQLGVIGFIYTMIHGLLLLFITGRFSLLIPRSLTTPRGIAILSFEVASIIYIGMILISNNFVIHEIGGQRWRQLLRVGYIAFVLSIIHMAINAYDTWLEWIFGKSTLFPPFGLFVFLFGLAVIGLRIVLWFATYKKVFTPAPVQTPTPLPIVEQPPQQQ